VSNALLNLVPLASEQIPRQDVAAWSVKNSVPLELFFLMTSAPAFPLTLPSLLPHRRCVLAVPLMSVVFVMVMERLVSVVMANLVHLAGMILAALPVETARLAITAKMTNVMSAPSKSTFAVSAVVMAHPALVATVFPQL
jgi:hypothetical protein